MLGHKAGRQRCSLELHRHSRRAAYLLQPRAIAFHRRIVCQPGADFTEDVGSMSIRRFNKSVVNPFAVPASRNNARTPEVGKMPRDFWLIQLQHFHEEADANFILPNQVNQSQTRSIRERLEEKSDAVFVVGHAGLLI